MNLRTSVFAAAFATALVAPAACFASSEFHPANGEIGDTHPFRFWRGIFQVCRFCAKDNFFSVRPRKKALSLAR